MNSREMHKTLELMSNAINEMNPHYVHGNELDDIWADLPALGELYRYLEGLLQ